MKVNIDLGALPTLLTIIFVMLKLCNIIDWSWWWIFSPLLIPLVAFFLFGVIICQVYFILKLLNE